MQGSVNSITTGVLSGDSGEEKVLREAADGLDVDLFFAPTIQNLRNILFERPSSGILLSLPSLMGIDPSGRGFIQTLEQIYPVARVRLDRAKGTFALIASRNEDVGNPRRFCQALFRLFSAGAETQRKAGQDFECIDIHLSRYDPRDACVHNERFDARMLSSHAL